MVVTLKAFVHVSRIVQFIDVKIFIIFPYCLFNTHKISSGVTAVIQAVNSFSSCISVQFGSKCIYFINLLKEPVFFP